jgi:hypothetical protein
MRYSTRRSLVRFVPKRMRNERGRNVGVVLATFATVAGAVAFLWARGRRRLTLANS